jgi:hypothetical protein
MTDHLENAASGSGAAPVLFDLLSWFRQELPHLLQRLACIKPPPQTVEEVAAAAAEAGADEAAAAAAAAAAAVDGGSPNKEGGAARLLTTARVGTTAHESAAYARDSLAMRSLLESEVRREREAAEEAPLHACAHHGALLSLIRCGGNARRRRRRSGSVVGSR